ncbi:MAG: malonyl-CoA synthase [Gammaproteobacteria bacterium]|nr:malonyl-CoA synthase [Gammaproteobacteria bacterium]
MSNQLFDTLFAEISADSLFIQLADGPRWSYGDILRETAKVASALVAAGVHPGDRVAAQIDKSASAIALYLGTLRAGAVFLPLNTAYTANEIEYFVRDAEPALLICRPAAETALRRITEKAGSRLETLNADGNGGSWAKMVEAGASDFDTVERGNQDLAAILYTSGTTGRSKGAMITHHNLASNAQTLARLWQFTSDDVLLHALPIFHTHGLFVAINTILVSGASMLFLPKFDTDQVLALLPGATVMMGVPTFYTRLLDQPNFTRELTQNMRLFISGSAPLLEETHIAFRQRTGQAILERYGMTETNMNTSNPYDGSRRAGTVGFPLADVTIRVTDPDTGINLPHGEIGMLEVRGPNVFKGYWRRPEKTAEEFRKDGFFITGDLGKIDDRGYLVIVGRGKDLIISGGFNVYPKEVEIEIDALPGIIESAVVGLPHPDFGEGVTAVVVAQHDSVASETEIKLQLTGRLARYKQPKRIFFCNQLPRNSMGKVQKYLLREQYKDIYSTS